MVTVTLCSRTRSFGTAVHLFCNSCGKNLERSRSYQEKHSKMTEVTFLLLLHPTFSSLKTAAKAHTELQQGNDTMNIFLIKKYAIEKNGTKCGIFIGFFPKSRPAREKRLRPSANSLLVLPFH